MISQSLPSSGLPKLDQSAFQLKTLGQGLSGDTSNPTVSPRGDVGVGTRERVPSPGDKRPQWLSFPHRVHRAQSAGMFSWP